jgi:hypothetical protein
MRYPEHVAARRDHVQHVLEQWRREAPELDRSPMGVVGRISRLAQLLQVELERVFAAHGQVNVGRPLGPDD